jgi:peptidoglycan/LPS O-acetylase OafA/YrhL
MRSRVRRRALVQAPGPCPGLDESSNVLTDPMSHIPADDPAARDATPGRHVALSRPAAAAGATTYRADIDGLRAVAVLAVVAFHAFPDALAGGFVGVDVFFVISGYLISRIIFQGLERGTFSVAGFYARRILRIFPALILVLVACLAFGWFGLLADEYRQLGKHVIAGAGFVSNLALWSESGYFDNSAETKPLRHLWSLGLEEQFYIFWPLLAALAWRSRAGLLLVTTAILGASFVLNLHGVGTDAVAAFYSPLTRFWELSVGSLLAYLVLHGHVQAERLRPAWANGRAWAGAGLLIAAVACMDRSRDFPGWWALMPVLGTAFVIAAGERAWLNRAILSHPLAVGFGLISFPLYLWHWPLLSFGRMVAGHAPSLAYRLAAVAVATGLAWATWRYLELNVRFRRGRLPVIGLVAGCAGVALAGLGVVAGNGLASRAAIAHSGFDDAVRHQLAGPGWAYMRNDACLDAHPSEKAKDAAWSFCIQSDRRAPTLILLGNSFANELYPGFAGNPLFRHHTVLSIGACNIAGFDVNPNTNPSAPCSDGRMAAEARFIDDLVAQSPSIRFAIIDGLAEEPSPAYTERLRRRIDLYEKHGVEVIVFTPHLRPLFNPRTCFVSPLGGGARDCAFPAGQRQAALDKVKPLMDAIARTHPKVRFFEQNDIFCRGDHCSWILRGLPLVRDESHLSEFASVELQKSFATWAAANLPEILDAGFVGR